MFLGRRDKLERPIIDALEERGVLVWQLPGGGGSPDLLCWYDGYWQPGEVKSGQPRKRTYVMVRRTRKRGAADSPFTVNSTLPSKAQAKKHTQTLWPTWASVSEALATFGLS